MKTSEAIRAASKSLNKDNWHKGSYFATKDGKMCMCAHGALQAQENEHVKKALREFGPDVAEASAWASRRSVAAAAAGAASVASESARSAAAAAATVNDFPSWANRARSSWACGCVGLTTDFNDDPKTTLRQVKLKMAKAAKLAEAAGD